MPGCGECAGEVKRSLGIPRYAAPGIDGVSKPGRRSHRGRDNRVVPHLEGGGHRGFRVCGTQRSGSRICPRCSSCLITVRRRPLARYLTGHTIVEAKDRGWEKLSNGDLLAEAERAGFEVLLTADTGIAYQQNLKDRKIALVVLSGNRWRLVQRVLRKITLALDAAEPGSYTLIEVPLR